MFPAEFKWTNLKLSKNFFIFCCCISIFSILGTCKTTTNPHKIISDTTSEDYLKVLSELTQKASEVWKVKLNQIESNFSKPLDREKRRIPRQIPENISDANPMTDYSSSYELSIFDNMTELFEEQLTSVIVDFAFLRTSKASYLVGAGNVHINGSHKKVPSPIWKWNSAIQKFQLLTQVKVDGAVDVEGVIIDDNAYFIFALNTKKNYMDFSPKYSRLYKIVDDKVRFDIAIRTIAATKWKTVSVGTNLYFFQASYLKWKKQPDRRFPFVVKGSTEVRIFKWLGESLGLIEVDKVQAMYTTDIEVTKMKGKTILVVVSQTIEPTAAKSTVLIYELVHHNHEKLKVQIFQRIHGHYVSDVHLFHVGNDLFLSIAYKFKVVDKKKVYNIESVLFRYNGLFFVKYQTFLAECALQWISVHGPGHEFALILQTSTKNHILQFLDGTWTERPQSLGDALGEATGPQKPGALSINMPHQNLLILAREERIYFYSVLFRETMKLTIDEDLTNRCSILRKNIINVTKAIIDVSKSLQLFSLSTDQTVIAKMTFENTIMKSLQIVNMIIKNNDLFRILFLKRIAHLEVMFDSLPKNVNGLLTRSGTQILPSGTVLHNVQIDRLVSERSHWSVINGFEFCNHVKAMIWLKSAISVRGFHFQAAIFKNSVTLSGLINNVNFTDGVVNRLQPNSLTGRKIFANRIVIRGNLNVIGDINGLHPDEFLLTHTEQHIHNTLIIHGNAIVGNLMLEQENSINGISWQWIQTELVHMDGPVEFTGHKVFLSTVTVDNNLYVEHAVNGVNVSSLFLDSIKLNEDFIFSEHVSFTDVEFIEDLVLLGPLNGVRVPQDLILVNSSVWNSNLIFHQPVVVHRMNVHGTVNKIKLFRSDVMTVGDVQNVTGSKTIREMTVNENIVIMSVNEYNLTDLLSGVKAQRMPAKKNYEHLTVNRITALRLPEKFQRLLSEGVSTTRPHAFTGHIYFNSTTIFNKDVIVTSRPSVFAKLEPRKSSKTLHLFTEEFSILNFQTNIHVHRLNGVDLDHFYANILYTTGHNKIVRVDKVFEDDIHVTENSLLFGKVNDYRLEDLVRIDQHVIIDTEVEFIVQPLVQETSEFLQVYLNDLQGRPFKSWFEETLTVDNIQVITAPKIFKQVLTIGHPGNGIEKNITVEGTIYMESVNITELIENSVLSGVRNDIRDLVSFGADISIENLYVDYIDDINVKELLENSLKRTETRCLHFNDVHIENLIVPRINDFNIHELLTDVVKLTDSHLPSGLHFANVTVPKIEVTGLVNNVRFSTDVVTKTKPEIEILAPKSFRGSATFDHLEVHGLINQVNLTLLNMTVMKQYVDQSIDGVLKVDHLIVEGDLDGALPDLDLPTFMKEILFIDENSIVTGLKEFHTIVYDPTNKESLRVKGFVDNTNLTYVYKNMVTLDTPQNITGPLIFSDVNMKQVEIVDLIASPNSLINGVKLAAWSKSVLKNDEEIQIIKGKRTLTDNVEIENNLFLEGTLNGLRTQDLMRIKGQQRVTGDLKFSKIVVRNLQVDELLMGINVTEWYRYAIMKNSIEPVYIKSEKIFQNVIFKDNVTFLSTLDNVHLSNIMTTHSNQTVTGKKIFTNEVIIPHWRNVDILHVYGDLRAEIDILYGFPLQYPCHLNELYASGWCYQILLGIQHCFYHRVFPQRGTDELMWLESLNLKPTIGGWLDNASSSPITVCKRRAFSINNRPIVLKGSIFVKEDVIIGSKKQALLSPAQQFFPAYDHEFHVLMGSINASKTQSSNLVRSICVTVDKINDGFQDSLRKWSPYEMLQTIMQDIIRVYPIYGLPMQFLAVKAQEVVVYSWERDQFRDTSMTIFERHQKELSLHTSQIFNLELDNFEDSGSSVILLPINRACPSATVDELLIWAIKPLDHQVELTYYNPLKLNCILPSAISLLFVPQRQPYLLAADGSRLHIWQWQGLGGGFRFIDFMEGELPIIHVKSLKLTNHILIVTKAESHSVFHIYRLEGERLILQTSLVGAANVNQLLTVYQNGAKIIFVDHDRLRLLQYYPDRKVLVMKQILDGCSSVVQLNALETADTFYIVASSSCGYTEFYILSEHLQKRFRVEMLFWGRPISYVTDHESYQILQITAGNSDTKETVVLRATKQGPAMTKCVPLCD